MSLAKKEEQMVFHTGAALLDAIVLAVVSMEETGTYGYRITHRNRHCIRFCEGFRKMSVWKYMIDSLKAETDGIIK